MRSTNTLRWSPLVLIFLLSTIVAAWPWPGSVSGLTGLVARQDNNENENRNSTQTDEEKQDENKDTENDNSSASSRPSPTSTSNGNGTRSKDFDARLPPGGVALQSPSVFDGLQFYKMGDTVEIKWNYTSLLAEPTAIDILATCTVNKAMYTIAANQTFDRNGSLSWDTGKFQETERATPLLTEMYTLIIHDSDVDITTPPKAGYLGTYNQFQFGLYSPQPYVPLDEFQCATCSGALGVLKTRAIGFVLGMFVVTVGSFSWFVSGTGVLW